METVLFVGIQAAGKSTFFRRHFSETHVRLAHELLHTRDRERLLFQACLEGRQPVVLDNENATRADRAKYIQASKSVGHAVIGYYFRSDIDDCIRRNARRQGRAKVPLMVMKRTKAELEIPATAEGFDELYYVRIDEEGQFVVESWR